MQVELEQKLFNAEWREQRFVHAILQRAALEDNELKNSPSVLVQREYKEALNVIQIGMFHLYRDMVLNGDVEQLQRARDIMGVLNQSIGKDR